jgi:hypothetical protein
MLFKRVYIEIGNLCNLHCSFCSERVRPPRQMTLQEFTRAVEQVKPYTDYLYFHIKGEPLVHPLLPEFLAVAAGQGMQVTITTNGTLLPEKGQILLQSPAVRQVNLSLHSFSAHDGIDPDAYLDRCIAFARENAALGRYTTMRFWNLSGGPSAAGDRQADAGTLRILSRIQAAFPGHDDLPEQLQSRSVALGKGIFVSFDEEFVWPSLSQPFVSEEGFCHGLRQMLGVLADGTVVPCCLDADGQAALGNLFTEELADILARDPFRTARQQLYNRRVVLPLCRHCSYRKRFG